MTEAYLSKRGNQTDAVDESASLKAEQFAKAHKLSEKFRKRSFDTSTSFKTEDEYSRNVKLWPKKLGQLIHKIIEESPNVKDAASDLTNYATMIGSKTVSKWFEGYIPATAKEEVKDRSNFTKISGNPIHEALTNGNAAIVSRVVETNIGWLVDDLSKDIEVALSKRKQPELTIVLSAPSKLTEIAQNEVNSAIQRENAFESGRGICSSEIVTGVRHLALWSGTMRALSILRQRFPSNIQIYLNEGEPSERGNIVKVDGNIKKVFCVECQDWGIGLDSDFYEIIDYLPQREFEEEIMKKTTRECDANKIESVLDVALKAEEKLMDTNISGQRLRDVVSNEMEEAKKRGLQICWKSIEKGEGGFVPWFMDLPLESESFDAIKESQKNIENYILPSVCKKLSAY